ncbi:type II toxin-antitoxin system RelE/ParE family toxin [Terasakiella sp. A23]|uniref:type II toxin-antitoxin system RelE/ParE family toxin n=1 Tax=Terasakiella sp. FCG-A23 TaxID=3080561 RepID=UPI0029543A1A|nr:type II toxin-antitoxin system RelE/ParE family toxin [Terasakiella sp. A23]MDV7341588.1 type II toxin-antitoxin system RelE/ParE family toxin [Terasakiella sp. A23]
MSIVWLPEAQQDVQRLFDFLLPLNPTAAEHAVKTIADGAAQLNEFGDIGRPMDDDTGRRELFLPFGASHYVLRYMKTDSDIVIIRVWHSKEIRN